MYRKLIVEQLDPAFRKVTRIVDCVLPVPKPTEVLIRLCFAGVNASDVNFSAGRYLPGASPPLDCGFEGVGIVEAAGSKAAGEGLVRGSAVAVLKYGCFAEYILADMEHQPTSHAPSCTIFPMKSATADVIPLLIGGLTSSVGLEQAGEMRSGETVLVTGAAGGTGAFAVQLAALAGNRVVGTCGSDAKVAVLKRLGCERAINYKTEDVEAVLKAEYPEGIDLVFEGVGGEMFEICKRCLAPTGGRLVIMGFTSQYTKQDAFQCEEAKLVRSRGQGPVRGFLLKNFPELQRPHLERLQGLVEEGKLESLCDPRDFLGLEQVADAVEHLHAARNVGKVLVRLSSPEAAAAPRGPLAAELCDCVEVSGLESESGQKLNGQKGAVMAFFEEKGRYAVRFAAESLVNLKPENLRKLSDTERLHSLQAEALELLGSGEVQAQLGALKAQHSDASAFDRAKERHLAAALAHCCERHGVDWAWLQRMGCELAGADEALAEASRRIEDLTNFDSIEDPRACTDEEKLRRLLAALLAILESEGVSALLAQLRQTCTNKAEFEGAQAERVYPLLMPAYAQFGVDYAWQESLAQTLRQTDQDVDGACKRIDACLAFSIGGPLGLEKNECVEVSGLESESGRKLNGERAFVQGFAEDKGRYLVLVPPENFLHLKPENLRKISEKEKLTSVLEQALVRLGTPQATAELEELRSSCESREQFEAARYEKLAMLLERTLGRYGVDVGWLLASCAHFGGEDERILERAKELDRLIAYGVGPLCLEKGACVQVDGLDAENGGKKLNGKRGFAQSWIESKGCYAVKFPPENYYVDLKPENLTHITDKEKVAVIMEQALTRCKQAKADLKEARSKCSNREDFERLRGGVLESLLGGVCTRYGVDLGWFFAMSTHLSGEDERLAEQREQLLKLIAFDAGPLGLEKNECVEVSGLASASELELEGRAGLVQGFDEERGRYLVLFPPERVASLQPESLQRSSERSKLASFLEQASAVLGATEAQAQLDELRERCPRRELFEAGRLEKLPALLEPLLRLYGVDLGWFFAAAAHFSQEDEEIAARRAEVEELLSFGTLGPLKFERGNTCVEIVGLESEAGKQMNGQKGMVSKWIREKERYEVSLGPEKSMALKAANLRKLGDQERLLCLQQHLAQVMATKEIAGPVNRLRREATTALQFGKAAQKHLATAMAPVFERYGVDAGWQAMMLAAYGEDPEIKAATTELEQLSSWGTIGPDKWEKGCYLEVHSLSSESGKKMNGMAVFLRGYDETKGRYDVSPADDLGQTKALKGENLRLIPLKQFSGIEEATLFQLALMEAYSTPEAKEMLGQVKAASPSMQHYLSALRPRLLDFQKPVLERFGFRPDFVGQQHMQRALGPWEADPGILQRNLDTERMLGLPERGQ